MSGRIPLSQAVIVEGKYDKIRLESVIDALILTTDGFRIFKDKEMRALIRTLAKKQGIVVLTDSDAAGFRIRSHLNSIAADGQITQVYIPTVPGKERRKTHPGKEGLLGVEGIDNARLRQALADAGLLQDTPRTSAGLTHSDLYEWGLTGCPDSRALRTALLDRLELPRRLSTSALLDVLNYTMTRPQLEAHLEALILNNNTPQDVK